MCIASGDARTLITAEPAVVIPMESDLADDEANGHTRTLFDDATEDLPTMSTRHLRNLKNTTVGPSLNSPQHRKRKSVEEGAALPSIPSLPLQPGAMMRRPSFSLRTPRANPESPASTNVKATIPDSPTYGRRGSGSPGSRNRRDQQSPGQGRRGSFAAMKAPVNSPRSGSLLLSPSLQQSQKEQPGRMMRRMSRRMSASNASLPTTPELGFS